MATTDPIAILLAQNRWATRNLLETCSSLPAAQFHQRFDMGPGSLHDTVTHILGAMRGWGDLLAGREQRPRLEGTERTPDELLQMLDELADDLEASARTHPVDEEVTGSRGERTYTFTRGGVLTHVLTHGMHHRAQCLNMLRQMGVEELPASAVVEWILMEDGATVS
ncbi:MAG: DUF664 domain-containing protein [Phycisphaerales bacterium]|nr:DUF664 domain-containing protein [Phycisphaerales bacterium]NNM24814.1 DUF664 domain-containing protein [Phycisphaerales bacterium]